MLLILPLTTIHQILSLPSIDPKTLNTNIVLFVPKMV